MHREERQSVFDFEYGVRWVTHIRYHRPQIVKVLVRLHPDDPVADTAVQLSRLQLVSYYLHGPERRLFMFELLVPATTPEDKEAGPPTTGTCGPATWCARST